MVFACSLALDHLLGGLCSWLFSFLFLYVISVGVVNALINGENEEQERPKTSGGSLLSDE